MEFPSLPLPPPAVSTVPVITPAAKKAKNMMAAGCETALGRMGGRAKETEPRLFSPIITSNRSMTIRKTVLKRSFAFMASELAETISAKGASVNAGPN